jgi:hypothetical protein
MVSSKARRFSTGTESLQIAKEKLRQFESAQARGEDLPLPTRTPIAAVLTAYVSHIRNVKTPKSAQTDIYYLRDAFGPVCEALKVTSRKVSAKTKKRPPKPGQDRRRKAAVIEASCLEQVTTADIAAFISGQAKSRGLAPKTANRYREILTRLTFRCSATIVFARDWPCSASVPVTSPHSRQLATVWPRGSSARFAITGSRSGTSLQSRNCIAKWSLFGRFTMTNTFFKDGNIAHPAKSGHCFERCEKVC